jgi:hypothetical protein
VSDHVDDVVGERVQNGQSMYLVFQQKLNCVENAEGDERARND